jgi:hypothetical protein
MMVNNELGRIRKEVVVAYFKIFSKNLPGGIEITKSLGHDDRSPCLRLQPGPPDVAVDWVDSWFVFRRPHVHISVHIPKNLTEVSHGFSPSLKTNADIDHDN